MQLLRLPRNLLDGWEDQTVTAEVAIANANAIALAADSAVTIGGQKIYNSALKLFSLSKTEPIGIMIYGNAGLLDLPWETIIKSFRQDLGATSFDRVEEYCDSFFEYIKNHSYLFSEEIQLIHIEDNVRGYLDTIREELKADLHELFAKQGQAKETEIDSIFGSIVNKNYDMLQDLPYINGGNKTFESKVRAKYKSNFSKCIEVVFEQLSLKPAVLKKLIDVSVRVLTREIYPDNRTGIVIAGYGNTEYYPSIQTYEIGGYVSGKLKFRKVKDKCLKLGGVSGTCIIPFAQEDMVGEFMSGMNPSVQQLIYQSLSTLFKRLPELLPKATKEATKEQFEEISVKLLKEFIDGVDEYVRKEHVTPVLSMVAVLPKDELARMAEALVNLTAFKRRMSNDIETVGGPIDVAVISKGDGLVWVERKHYFPRELNHQFFNNYSKGIYDEKG